MNRVQRLNGENITCDRCRKIVARKDAFFIYEYECCSIECLKPLQKERQEIEEARKDENTSKSHGAFVYSMGEGAY